MNTSTKIREKLQAKRQEAEQAWKVFEPLQTAINTEDFNPADDRGKQALNEAHDASKAYTLINGEVKSLEDQYAQALEMDGLTKPGETPFSESKAVPESLRLMTPGQRVVDSEAYKGLTDSDILRSQNSPFRLEVKALSRDEHIAMLESPYSIKTLLQSGPGAEPGDTLLRPTRLPGYLEKLQAPLKLRNLITVGATDGNTVEWVRQLTVAAAAAEVAEATATSGSSGTKPESGMTFDLQNTVVQTIAHWIPATRAALADMAQLRTIIDSQLLDGVARRLNTQILKGNGTAPNLKGILASGIQAQNSTVQGVAGARKIERVLAAITKIRLAFLEPSAILMHPLDFEEVRLTKDENKNYQFGPPSQSGETTLWGIPIIQDTTVDQDQPIIGDWSQAILYVRDDVSVLASDSHADFFVRNMIVVLAEGRYALAVPRPDAFCTVDFAAAEV